jgi:hypothetical protein
MTRELKFKTPIANDHFVLDWTRLANIYVAIARNGLRENPDLLEDGLTEKDFLKVAAIMGGCTAAASAEQRGLLKEAIEKLA